MSNNQQRSKELEVVFLIFNLLTVKYLKLLIFQSFTYKYVWKIIENFKNYFISNSILEDVLWSNIYDLPIGNLLLLYL